MTAPPQMSFDLQRQHHHKFNAKMMILDGVSWVSGIAFLHANVVIPGFLLHFTNDPIWPNFIVALTFVFIGIPQIFSVFLLQYFHQVKKPLLFFASLQRFFLFIVAITAFYAVEKNLFHLKIWVCSYLLFHFMCGMCFPIWFSYLGRLLDPLKRGSVLGKQVFFSNCASMIAALLVIWILKQDWPFAIKYGRCFLIGWFFICLGLIPLGCAREAILPVVVRPVAFYEFIRQLLHTFSSKPFRWFCLAMICWTSSFMIQGILVQHGLEQHPPSDWDLFQKKDAWVGFWTVLILFSQMIAGHVMGKLADRSGAKKVLAYCFCFYALIPLYALLPVSRLFYSLTFFLFGFAMGSYYIGLATLWEFSPLQETPRYICVQEILKIPFILFFSILGGKIYGWNLIWSWNGYSFSPSILLCFGGSSLFCWIAAMLIFRLKTSPSPI